jgi:hypothetical protein
MSAHIIPLPLPAPAVARIAGRLLSNIDEAASAGEITDAGVADAVHWLEGWVCAQSERLGVEIVT